MSCHADEYQMLIFVGFIDGSPYSSDLLLFDPWYWKFVSKELSHNKVANILVCLVTTMYIEPIAEPFVICALVGASWVLI